jgi:predicted AAA+ superfamily ATPase
MLFSRTAADVLQKSAKEYPVVTIVGPRQVGKTTLSRAIFPHLPYANLEDPDVLAFANYDPRGFLDQFPEGGILDEIQNAPKLLSFIQVIVDEKNKNGLFILTGSQQLELGEAVSQSLAGRTALITLLPLSIQELAAEKIDLDIDDLLLRGFLPRIYTQNLEPSIIYRNYVKTYLERDVRKISKVHDLSLFQKFLRLCAARVGSILNQENLGNEVGVSATTINHWFSILEASYIVFRIQPYFENLGKRVIKSPKIYFFDVGLVSYLLDIETTTQMSRDPLRGNLFENLVLLELIKSRLNKGLEHNLYFFRDSHGNEVDFIYKKAHNLVPIEIKSAKSFDKSFIKKLIYFRRLAGDRVPNGYLVYSGDLSYQVDGFDLINYKNVCDVF